MESDVLAETARLWGEVVAAEGGVGRAVRVTGDAVVDELARVAAWVVGVMGRDGCLDMLAAAAVAVALDPYPSGSMLARAEAVFQTISMVNEVEGIGS